MLQLFIKDVNKVNSTRSLDDLSTMLSFKKITLTAKTFLQDTEKEKTLFCETNTEPVNDSTVNCINVNEIKNDVITAHDVRLHPISKSGLESEAFMTDPNEIKPKNTKKIRKSREDFLKEVCMKNTHLVYKCFDPYHKGYIDIDEVVNQFEVLSAYHDFDSILHRLISILQDLKCVISNDGVIEKCDAIANLYHSISRSGRTCPVYSLLQTHSHKLSQELKKLYDKEHTMKPFYAHKPSAMSSIKLKKIIPYASYETRQIESNLPVVNPLFDKLPNSRQGREHFISQPFNIFRKEPHVSHSKNNKESEYKRGINKKSSSDSDTHINRFMYPLDFLEGKTSKTKRKKHPQFKSEKGYRNHKLHPTAFRFNDSYLSTHGEPFNLTEDQRYLHQDFVDSLSSDKTRKTNNKHSSNVPHYVIHNGEPARKPYPKWEDDLRVSCFENFSYNYTHFKTSAT
ncbi:uncharacterized protein LOC128884016 [Hylaeus volcanicus]|uniref:uncharacterized protein LOC128884016 n=1 Tax=Hylaeus volcanicus TaxID=313075 RepID=UPI0023B78805|nr:uncharacterized protein LOC128884016 [Hylaeus volcanicus]